MTEQLKVKKHQRFEQVFHRNYRYCDCAMPMVSRKWNDALGRMVTIRLCCMARAVEELTGKKLYEVEEFDPRWKWDCRKVEQKTAPDGTSILVEKGPPAGWLLKRMQEKGIEIDNME